MDSKPPPLKKNPATKQQKNNPKTKTQTTAFDLHLEYTLLLRRFLQKSMMFQQYI